MMDEDLMELATRNRNAYVERFADIKKLIDERQVPFEEVFASEYDFSRQARGLTYDPNFCLNTKHKREMWYAFELHGAAALTQYLYDYGKAQAAKGFEGYQYYLEDTGGRRRLCYYIRLTDPEVIKALICGNLAYRYETEDLFRTIVNDTSQIDATVGVYYLIWKDSGHNPEITSQTGSVETQISNKGKGFSIAHWQEIYDTMEAYLDTSKSSSSLAVAIAIDSVFANNGHAKLPDYEKDPLARKYVDSAKTRTQIENFMSFIKIKYLDTTQATQDDNLINEQAKYAPTLVGHSWNVERRQKQHLESESTSDLFGLFNSIITRNWKKKFEVQSLQVVRIMSQQDCKLCEAWVTDVSSSYHYQGGLNLAGVGGIHVGTPPFREHGDMHILARLYTDSDPSSPEYTSPAMQKDIREGAEHVMMMRKRFDAYLAASAIEPYHALKQSDEDWIRKLARKYEKGLEHMESIDAAQVHKKWLDMVTNAYPHISSDLLTPHPRQKDAATSIHSQETSRAGLQEECIHRSSSMTFSDDSSFFEEEYMNISDRSSIYDWGNKGEEEEEVEYEGEEEFEWEDDAGEAGDAGMVDVEDESEIYASNLESSGELPQRLSRMEI